MSASPEDRDALRVVAAIRCAVQIERVAVALRKDFLTGCARRTPQRTAVVEAMMAAAPNLGAALATLDLVLFAGFEVDGAEPVRCWDMVRGEGDQGASADVVDARLVGRRDQRRDHPLRPGETILQSLDGLRQVGALNHDEISSRVSQPGEDGESGAGANLPPADRSGALS